ncbi:hypothetical protein LSAT2_015007 [Lamellibrachia satsuma]|nr:hypothetical protein LSAT2_015007 [Lamellibrachia satsuma]
MTPTGNRLRVLLFLMAFASMVTPPVAEAATYGGCLHVCGQRFKECLLKCKSTSNMKLVVCQRLYVACIRACA